MVIAWMDKKVVKMATTQHDGSMGIMGIMGIITRRKKKGQGMEEVSKPNCIIDYNKYMFGMDLIDQMSYYPVV